jgi:hypothetical protein
MEEALRIIYEKVETLDELKREIEQMVAPMKGDENFHKIAEKVIPEDLRKGHKGYSFLKTLLGDKQANKLHIQDPELKKMKAGEGI